MVVETIGSTEVKEKISEEIEGKGRDLEEEARRPGEEEGIDSDLDNK